MTNVNGHYLRALEALAKEAEDLEWMYSSDDGSMENPELARCPWCSHKKKDGHSGCPFGAALKRVRRLRKV